MWAFMVPSIIETLQRRAEEELLTAGQYLERLVLADVQKKTRKSTTLKAEQPA